MKISKVLNCKFTDAELKEIGMNLALANQEKERLEDQKKQSMSQYKSEQDAVDSKIRELAQKLARGSEDRRIECELLYNVPEEGKKTITRLDTKEVIETANMTEEELNDLFINNLGPHKDEKDFVFRDRSRAQMVNHDEYVELVKKEAKEGRGEYKKKADGLTAEKLADMKLEKNETALVVYSMDPETKKDIFELYQFEPTAAPEKKDAKK